MTDLPRCRWCPPDKPVYVAYHDTEWGVPVHDDRLLFEMLCLEGAQAGLSWYSILIRRDGYRRAFRDFDPAACAALTDAELEHILATGEIIRNRLKVWSVRRNAAVFLKMQAEFGSFDAWLWAHVGGRPKINRPAVGVATSPESDAISTALKRQGMNFVGSTIIYAYMQAVGLVNDHMVGCHRMPPPEAA